MKSGVSLRCARSTLVDTSHYSRVEKPTYRLPPKNDYHVCIARSTYHYAYARQTQVSWRKETSKINEDIGNERKNKKALHLPPGHRYVYAFFFLFARIDTRLQHLKPSSFGILQGFTTRATFDGIGDTTLESVFMSFPKK